MIASRNPVRVLLVSALILIVLLPPAAYFWIKSAEERGWEEMRRYCEETAAELRARSPERPLLRGTGVPGNAWDDYEAALRAVKPTQKMNLVNDYLEGKPDADREKVRAFLQHYLPAVESLRHGATRSSAAHRVDWAQPKNTQLPSTSPLMVIVVGRARMLSDEGSPRAAMELLLDLAQFGRDWGFNGSSIDGFWGLDVLSNVQGGLRELLTRRTLRQEDYLELGRCLERLDRDFPDEAAGYSLESMTVGFDYLRLESLEGIQQELVLHEPLSPTWRYAMSDRLVLLDAFRWSRLWNQQLREAVGKSWTEELRFRQVFGEDLRKSPNPLMQRTRQISERLAGPSPISVFRERRAQLRLLRMAVAWRATGEIPALDDPYGDKLHSSLTGTHLKLWSVGSDGVDDGGSGEWKARNGKDIVLEVDQ